MADRMALEKYFHVVHKLLETHWAVDDHNVSYSAFSRADGIINGRVFLLDGSYIDFLEEIFVVKKTIVKGKYHYQFIKDSAVFRYDNYSRHPGITSPFHHKHSSTGTVQLEAAPKLVDVIVEAARYIFP